MAYSVFPAPSAGVTQKVSEFTSTGTFTAPSNCSAVEIFLVGGGGGGGGVRSDLGNPNVPAGGGGGGGFVIKRTKGITTIPLWVIVSGSFLTFPTAFEYSR